MLGERVDREIVKSPLAKFLASAASGWAVHLMPQAVPQHRHALRVTVGTVPSIGELEVQAEVGGGRWLQGPGTSTVPESP